MRTNITTASPAGSSGARRYGTALAVLLVSVAVGVGMASQLHHDLGPRAYGEPAAIAAGPEAITTYDPVHSRSLPATTGRGR
jgi:hypothetical protein